MKTDFHNKDLALSLDLKWRLRWTRKWPILWLYLTSQRPSWWKEQWRKSLLGIWLYYYAKLEQHFAFVLTPTWPSYTWMQSKNYLLYWAQICGESWLCTIDKRFSANCLWLTDKNMSSLPLWGKKYKQKFTWVRRRILNSLLLSKLLLFLPSNHLLDFSCNIPQSKKIYTAANGRQTWVHGENKNTSYQYSAGNVLNSLPACLRWPRDPEYLRKTATDAAILIWIVSDRIFL